MGKEMSFVVLYLQNTKGLLCAQRRQEREFRELSHSRRTKTLERTSSRVCSGFGGGGSPSRVSPGMLLYGRGEDGAETEGEVMREES